MTVAAPYPSTTRAKGWRFELDMERIRQSDTWVLATPEIRPWLLLLWATSWEQVPCGSLPDNDELIAARIGMAPKAFAKARPVLMRGWWLADDGRQYHDTIASRVIAMSDAKHKESQRKADYRARMEAERARDGDSCPASVPRDTTGTDDGRTQESRGSDPGCDDTGTSTGTGTGTSKEKERGDTPLKPPARAKRLPPGPLPEWIPAKEWAEFVAHRKAMRGIPFTDAAQAGVIAELTKFRAKGHDPAALLTNAITRGWRTVFEPKADHLPRVAPVSFDEARIAAKRTEVAKWTGGRLNPDALPKRPDFIDMEEPNATALTRLG